MPFTVALWDNSSELLDKPDKIAVVRCLLLICCLQMFCDSNRTVVCAILQFPAPKSRRSPDCSISLARSRRRIASEIELVCPLLWEVSCRCMITLSTGPGCEQHPASRQRHRPINARYLHSTASLTLNLTAEPLHSAIRSVHVRVTLRNQITTAGKMYATDMLPIIQTATACWPSGAARRCTNARPEARVISQPMSSSKLSPHLHPPGRPAPASCRPCRSSTTIALRRRLVHGPLNTKQSTDEPLSWH